LQKFNEQKLGKFIVKRDDFVSSGEVSQAKLFNLKTFCDKITE
jgi:hypothetical protein